MKRPASAGGARKKPVAEPPSSSKSSQEDGEVEKPALVLEKAVPTITYSLENYKKRSTVGIRRNHDKVQVFSFGGVRFAAVPQQALLDVGKSVVEALQRQSITEAQAKDMAKHAAEELLSS